MRITEKYRKAPDGFTLQQWELFNQDGIIIIEDAISDDGVAEYIDAIDRVTSTDAKYQDGEYWGKDNIVELNSVFTNLIDHSRHVGFAYDIFGELLKLHQSQIFIRPPGDNNYNIWHPDGARALPYGVFSSHLPLQIKIGYWLTDISHQKMGNMVVMPGSHRQQYLDAYDTHESVSGERILCLPKGTMTIMNSSIWHRVEPNESEVTRKNIFVAYCPSWITPADRLQSSPEWMSILNREQRIIMRSYKWAYLNAKPPAEDFPLFLDREIGLDCDPFFYSDQVKLHRRKRKIMPEKLDY